MTQVNPDNVLAVRNAIKIQADQIQQELQQAAWKLDLRPCGGDPISQDATPAFRQKIKELLVLHWAHHKELSDAVRRLDRTAQQYGFTEQQITDAFKKMTMAR